MQEIEQFYIDELHKAQKENNKDKKISSLLSLSQIHYKNKNYEKSQRALLDILEIDKKTPNIYYYLSIIYVDLGDKQRALELANNELKNYPKNKEVMLFKEQLEENTRFPLLTIALILINIIVYSLFEHPLKFTDLALYSASNFSINLSNIITSLFFHVNIVHLIVNMFILLMFGYRLEKNIGSLNFLIIFFLAGSIGNLLQALVIPNSFVIGASASLFGLMGALLMREPLLNFYFLGIFKVPIILFFGGFFSILYVLSELFLLQQTITEISHLIGLLTGILMCGIIYSQTRETFYNWLIIAIGFWGIMYSITDILFLSQDTSLSVAANIVIILIAGVMITYSYNLLKLTKTIRGDPK